MKKNFTLLVFAVLIMLFSTANADYIFQDFDNPSFPPNGWTITGSNPPLLWAWSVRCNGYSSGPAAAKCNFSDANNGYLLDLISPVFTPVAGDSLVFDHAYATYSTYVDYLDLFYSTNGGTTWTLLITLAGGPSGPLATAPPTGDSFVPTPAQWASKAYVLPAGTNRIKFSGRSGYGNNLFIDNVKIGTKYSIDVGADGYKRYLKAIFPGVQDTPRVQVKNFGSTTQSFSVNLTITPGGYSQTSSVTNLAPGSTLVLTMPVFSTSTVGNYVYKTTTTLAGDQNNRNDTLSSNYPVTTVPRNVMIEYSTGTWCNWCPCAKTTLLQLESYLPNNVIVLAYHGSGSDPWINFNGNSIIGLLGLTAYPLATPDRSIDPWSDGYSGMFEYSFSRYLNAPSASCKIDIVSKNYNPGTRQLDVNINSTAMANLSGQYKITYVITEENLVYSQVGNAYCIGGSNYVHHWVVRNIVNGATGENLNTGGVWNQGQIINKTFSTTLDASWVPANCNLQVFIYKDAAPLNLAEIQQGLKTSVTLVGVNDPGYIPLSYSLSQNYPNPFNPTTNIKFSIPKAGYATLKIYDATGRLVETYLDEYVKAGQYNAEVDGTNFSSGVYFYTLTAEGFVDTKKMILVK